MYMYMYVCMYIIMYVSCGNYRITAVFILGLVLASVMVTYERKSLLA